MSNLPFFRKTIGLLSLIGSISFLTSGCVSVRAYEKMYLQDPDMRLEARKLELYEHASASYREGAAGANGGKSGGGCGCN